MIDRKENNCQSPHLAEAAEDGGVGGEGGQPGRVPAGADSPVTGPLGGRHGL